MNTYCTADNFNLCRMPLVRAIQKTCTCFTAENCLKLSAPSLRCSRYWKWTSIVALVKSVQMPDEVLSIRSIDLVRCLTHVGRGRIHSGWFSLWALSNPGHSILHSFLREGRLFSYMALESFGEAPYYTGCLGCQIPPPKQFRKLSDVPKFSRLQTF